MSDKIKMISIGQLFKLAKRGYAQNFKSLLIMAILPYLATLLVALVLFLQKIGLGILDEGIIRNIYQLISTLLVFATYIFAFVFSNLSAIALIMMVKAAPEKMTVRQALNKAWPWLVPYIWVSIITSILLLLWALLLVIPAIIMAGYYSMAIWIVLDGQHRGYAALKQSKVLVRGYWWSIFWRQFVIVVVFLILLAILSYILSLFFAPELATGSAPTKENRVLSSIINFISSAVMPLYIIYFYNIYKNLVEIKNKSLANTQN